MPLITVTNEQVWVPIPLALDFTTANNAAPQLTGLAFTPEASKRYWIKGALLVASSSVTATVNLGLSWPSAGLDVSWGQAAVAQSRDSAAAQPSSRNYGALTPLSVTAGTSMDDNNESYWAQFLATLHTNGAAAGDLEVTLQVEAAGVATVTLFAGSTLWIWEY